MITEIVLLNFIFWEILCHTGYPTESLRFSQRKIDVDSPFCLLRGNVRVKKNPPSYELLSTSIHQESIQYTRMDGALTDYFRTVAAKSITSTTDMSFLALG